MNIFETLAKGRDFLLAGEALKSRGTLVNAEALGALLYAVVSAGVELAKALGLEVNIGATDLHTLSNGWAITATVGYAYYRVATSSAAGIK